MRPPQQHQGFPSYPLPGRTVGAAHAHGAQQNWFQGGEPTVVVSRPAPHAAMAPRFHTPHPAGPVPAARGHHLPPSGPGLTDASQPPAPTSVAPAVTVIAWAIVGAGLLTLVAAFLPWAGGLITVNGIGTSDVGATDGIITLVLGALAAVFGVVSALIGKRSAIHPIAGIVALLAGVIIVLVAVVDIGRVGDLAGLGVHVGIGLWLTALAGIAMTLVGIGAVIKRR